MKIRGLKVGNAVRCTLRTDECLYGTESVAFRKIRAPDTAVMGGGNTGSRVVSRVIASSLLGMGFFCTYPGVPAVHVPADIRSILVNHQ